MELKVERVDDLTTVFGFAPTNPSYVAFLAARKLAERTEERKATRAIENSALEIFSDIFLPYLGSLGIKPRTSTEGIYLRKGNEVDIYCEILGIPEKDAKISYEPEITFTASKNSLTATSHLTRERHGCGVLPVVEDFTKLAFPSSSGIDKPKIRFENDKLHVASIEQIPRLIKTMQIIYERVGEKRLEELAQIRDGVIVLAETRLGERLPVAAEILDKEYKSRLELLLPSDL